MPAARTPPAAREQPFRCSPRTDAGSASSSLDHLGHLEHDLRREGDAERAGRLHVDDEVEDRWLLDGEIGGLGALENTVCIVSGAAPQVLIVGTVAHQDSRLRPLLEAAD